MTDNTKPLVSIVVNCYNGEKYLKEALDSVIAQKYTNWEIVFWDNQSTDNSIEIVKSMNDDRIRCFITPVHSTLGEARNMAMKEIRGELVSFIDCDDVWQPDFLEKAVAVFTKDSERYSFYYSNYYNWTDGDQMIEHDSDRQSGEKNFQDILGHYTVGMSAVVVKKSVLEVNHIIFDRRYQLIEDYDFFLRLSHCKNAYYDATPLMKYRMHPGSLTNSMKMGWGEELQMLYDDLNEKLLAKEELDRYKEELKWLKVRIVKNKIEKFISEGHRGKAFTLLLKNTQVNYKLTIMLLAILLPQQLYAKIMHKIRRRDYYLASN